MVILQVDMFSRRSVAMPTFSSQISKLFLPFGRVQLEPAVAWGRVPTHLEQKEICWQKRSCALHKSVVLKWLRQKVVQKVLHSVEVFVKLKKFASTLKSSNYF